MEYVTVEFFAYRTKDKGSQLQEFWKGADFGYVLERRKEMKYMCAPENEVGMRTPDTIFGVCSDKHTLTLLHSERPVLYS